MRCSEEGDAVLAMVVGSGVLTKAMGVLTPQETSVLVSLPLPAALERLLPVTGAMNRVTSHSHIQVSISKSYQSQIFSCNA